MTNKITININIDEQTDLAKVAEAIGNLIKALMPQEDWEAVAAELKAQVEDLPVNDDEAGPFDGSTDYEQWLQEELDKAERRGDWG